MTRLELVKRLSRESGVNKVGPISSEGQVGTYLQLVEWIDEAYAAIQGVHDTWRFHKAPFSKALSMDDGLYAPADLDITDFKHWIPDGVSLYENLADEAPLHWLEWEDFQLNFGVGNNTILTGRPGFWTNDPDDNLKLYRIPDKAYILRGEYFQKNDVMTQDGDVPIYHEDYHMGIVWRALMYYGLAFAESDRYTVGMQEFKKVLRNMERKYLPKLRYGKTLA